MKKLILVLLMVLSVNVFSQARIGFTVTEIQEQLKDVPQTKIVYTDDGCVDMIAANLDGVVVVHQFSKYQRVVASIISPLHFGGVMELKTKYNKLYRKANPTTWEGPGDTKILLIDPPNGTVKFIWYDTLAYPSKRKLKLPTENKI